MQEALATDRPHEMRESQEGTVAGGDRRRSCRASRRSWSALTVAGAKSSLAASLICNPPLYLSSPSQNLNLQPSSTWLCGAENDLRTCPPGGRVSVYLRS
jgi:hypothetical protein